MDPLHLCIAIGPLAVYLLVLGIMNLSRRPIMTTGQRDAAALGIAISGFVVTGPMELFFPERAVQQFNGFAIGGYAIPGGAWVWGMLLALYILTLILIVLMMRPRLVIYNITAEQLRPVLVQVASRLDPEARWAGENLVMPQLEVQLHLEPFIALKNVQLVSSGPQQSFQGWRRLEQELGTAVSETRGTIGTFGLMFQMNGILLLSVLSYWLYRDGQGVMAALDEMLRQ